jgi:hypothetical protein
MRLTFTLPAGWRDQREGGGAVTLTDPAGDVRVEVSALLWKSDLQPLAVLERDPPLRARAEGFHVLDGRTRDGWPLHVVGYRFVGGDGQLVEARLGAVVEVLHFAAAAVARAHTPAALEGQRANVLAIFASARPHLWGQEPVTIAELWSMEEP